MLVQQFRMRKTTMERAERNKKESWVLCLLGELFLTSVLILIKSALWLLTLRVSVGDGKLD